MATDQIPRAPGYQRASTVRGDEMMGVLAVETVSFRPRREKDLHPGRFEEAKTSSGEDCLGCMI